jgi:hypothetical protein
MATRSFCCCLLLAAAILHVADARRGEGKVAAAKEDVKSETRTGEKTRSGKLFSLFNVVQFQNSACTSQLSLNLVTTTSTTSANTGTTTNRAGTCFAASQCASKGGQVSGSCAAGFGVCCVFVSTGGAVNQNCTFLQNPGFPSSYTGTGNVQYTLNKCNNNVCAFRLDFEAFMTAGPVGTVQAGGGVCQDSLTFQTTAVGNYPTICGSNAGQHIYLDPGQNTGDTATVNFAFTGASTTRTWDIKVTQVACGINTPPNGCFQYYTGTSGTISTFNFANAASTITANLQYNTCIRQAPGFCCVKYQVCPNVPSAYTINVLAVANMRGSVDSECTEDFLQIPGATSTCTSNNAAMFSRICGSLFTTVSGLNRGGINVPVCDCSPPFSVGFFTNNMAAPDAATQLARGVCLQYQQLPCQNT